MAHQNATFIVQGNLANTYQGLGQFEKVLSMRRDVYSGHLKLHGEEDFDTIREANNYAVSLLKLNRLEEAKSLLRKTMPVARRVIGESHELMLTMRWIYARALFDADSSTLDDIREAVTILEKAERTARRVFGGAHQMVAEIELALQVSRAALRARETPPPPGSA